MQSKYLIPGKKILEKIQSHGYEAYFVGGYVRDFLLNKITKNTEIDIATSATPQQLKKIFPKMKEVGKVFGVSLIVEDCLPFEVATFRKDSSATDGRRPSKVTFTSLSEDCKRRDLTINAIYMDINNKIIDPLNGFLDLKNKVISFIGNPEKRINEDHLRILRAVRFKNKLNFSYDKKTEIALKKHCCLTEKISPERTNEELTKILQHKSRKNGFYDLLNFKILDCILPEVSKLSITKQSPDYHAEGDVFIHTMVALDSIRRIKNKDVLWTLLLHDIGKPDTQTISDKIRFHGHEKVSTEKTKIILKRLRFTNKQISKICWLVENHMIMPNITKMRQFKRYRLFGHKWFKSLLVIFKADISGSLPNNFQMFNKVLESYANYKKDKPKFRKKFLTGNDIMNLLNIKPGPAVGIILRKIEDQVLEEKITSKDQAINYLKSYLTQ